MDLMVKKFPHKVVIFICMVVEELRTHVTGIEWRGDEVCDVFILVGENCCRLSRN